MSSTIQPFTVKVLLFLFIALSTNSRAQDLPPINLHYSSYAVSSDGKVLGYFGEQHRVDIKSTGYISKYVIWSLISTEDRDFYNHDGVSIKGIVRGIFKTLTGHTEGGSTLTMQLARNLFLTREKTISRKLAEIDLARKIEKKYTKDQILQMYLNTVYFGHGAYGIWTASEEYFGKTPDKLTITESATLVGLVQSPNGYDPQKHPDKTLSRRNAVLHNLVETGKITDSEYQRLQKLPLGLNMSDKEGGYFLEQVRREAAEILNKKGIYLDSDELTITTTLSSVMQHAAEDAVNFQWNKFTETMKEAQIGLISIEPGTGMIKALIGGNPNSNPRGLDRAIQIKRQPGSSFKPFLYGSLIEKGYTLGEPLRNIPVIIDSGTAYQWEPHNDDDKHTDTVMPMIIALKYSINLAAAYAITNLTCPDSVVSFAHRLGIISDLPSYPSIALGAAEVSPLEMASSYAVFADEGIYAKPFSILKIEDKNGNLLYNRWIDTSTVLDSSTAYITSTALKTVVDGGTGSIIRQYYKGLAAGKTGTSQNFTDAWFVGYVPRLSTAIWIGYDNPNKKLSGGYQYGGTACAPIWGKMMAEISRKVKEFSTIDFNKPYEIKDTNICNDTGEPVEINCKKTTIYPVDRNKIQLLYSLHKHETKETFDINHGW